jgi:hypothetical protein
LRPGLRPVEVGPMRRDPSVADRRRDRCGGSRLFLCNYAFSVRTLRALAFPLWLAWVRLASRAERVALVALGIAAGAAMLAAVLAGSLLAQDRSLRRATERIPQADRAVRAQWLGIPGQGEAWPALNRRATDALRELSPRRPVAVMLYRQTEVARRLVDLGAVDELPRFVRLTSGRLPNGCGPNRCEVLQLGGAGPIPSVPGLRLVRVGHATLRSQVPFGQLVTRETYRSVLSSALLYHTPKTPPFLVADGVAGLAKAPALDTIYRSYAWVLPVEPKTVHPWTVDALDRAVARTRSTLAAGSQLFDLTAPTEELRAADDRARVGARRLLLIGGEAAALLLAFTILAAAAMRRDVEAAWRRLTWFGARRWQLLLLTTAEAGVVAIAAAAVGWAAGAGVGAGVAGRLDEPVGAVLRHSVVSGGGFALAAGLAAAATLVLVAALRARPVRVGGLAVSAVDVAALGVLAVVLIGIARGSADTASLASGSGTGTFLLLLPGLVAFVAAVATARALGPALRLLERRGRAAPFAFRTAALSLARNPGRAAVAVTFLVVSLGLALFAQAYRATLQRGQSDEAAYAVPADDVLREDLTKLVPVLHAAPLRRYEALGGLPVLRRSADVTRLGGATLLGIPADAVPRVLGFRGDFSSLSQDELARRLRPSRPGDLHGVRVPPDARRLVLPVRVYGDDVTIQASVRSPRGDFVRLDFGRTDGPGTRSVAAPIAPAARGGLLVGLTLGIANTGAKGTVNGGTGPQPLARGELRLGPLRADGRGLGADYRRWLGVNGFRPLATDCCKARGSYLLSNEVTTRFRVRQPTDGRPLPAVVSPRLAAAAGKDGLLPLDVTGQRLLVRVVGTAKRFPSVNGELVLVDRAAADTALNADAPGAAAVDEIWLRSDRPNELERALRRPPFDTLALRSRRAVEHELRTEPLARGSLLVLLATAAAALVLALVGLVLGLVSEMRDESGELFDLETQGAGPPLLRRHLRLRSLAVAGFGLAGGLVTGVVLSALVVDLVTVTANAGSPQPPLRLAVGWPVVLAALAAYALLAAALVALITTGAFRARSAGRLSEATT